MTAAIVTAASRGFASCHACGLVSRLAAPAYESRCTRCDAVLHVRKPNSIGRTWALIIAAFVLYIPANLLPVTITRSPFGVQSDTIMSGVAYFWNTGSYDLAIIIFTASIFVPLAKLLALSLLTLLAQRHIQWDPLQCTRLYRMVEFIGKWSMLDVFVVALLSTLVDFSTFAAISAGPGAVAFGAVVVITMFAAMTFDPRLLWEPADHPGEGAARG
ncbi:MAG TPA: paraquat-inducible protein A [Burkholderiales bacterium]|jgi:paraquat-inducible protein A|nr:paraquat-inducible protein A [Burkholderiales bacterium]